MRSPFFAGPPKVSLKSPAKRLWKIACGFAVIVVQPLLPFSKAQPPKPIPTPKRDIDAEQVRQCQWIFEQTEDRYVQLERKAQWTFALMLFLAPILTSIFLFFFQHTPLSTESDIVALVLTIVSAGLLLLAFISIVRVILVKERETLFIGSVIGPDDGKFHQYDKAFHASGLLYCAAVNTALDDHNAQFVKGAQLLTAVAVVVLLIAAVPGSTALLKHRESPVRAEVFGSVSISSTELTSLRDEIVGVRKEIAVLGKNEVQIEWMKLLQDRVEKIELNLDEIKKAIADDSKTNQ